ncbi:MAG TPA: ABC transporter substrate-binding protein [Candidatus Eisenbacteria bacterium]|nr:ABC transporter substrate-binding protein [Candidatus Eisenbacteria bacterium]
MTLRPLTVLMPFYTPFYTPLAAGAALGHFREEGLDVKWMAAAAYGKSTVDAVLDGSIEISLGGLMRSFDLLDRGGRLLPHFAEVCSRSGFFLLGRERRPGFRWTDLVGKTVISFAEAPTPWQCMLTVLRRSGVDPATVNIERHRPGPEALAAFRSGHGDFFEQTQPIIEQMLAGGEGHLVASMGEATGPVPFTSYMTTPDFLRREPETILRFTRAIYRTQRWLAGHDAQAIADAVAPGFPDIDRAILERAVGRFSRQGTWSGDPILRRPGFDYLQDILQSGGFITKTHRYEDLVDTTIAERAVAELEGQI